MGFDLSNNVLGGEGFGYDENEDVSEVVRIMWWGEEGATIIMKMITLREHCCGGEGPRGGDHHQSDRNYGNDDSPTSDEDNSDGEMENLKESMFFILDSEGGIRIPLTTT